MRRGREAAGVAARGAGRAVRGSVSVRRYSTYETLDIRHTKVHTVLVTKTNVIPNQPLTPSDILRLARELDVPGELVSHGRKNETRAYPVALANGEILKWQVTAPIGAHYVGTVRSRD